jgi:3-hydroxybenzoate/4-hydroxybenzoate---CoA ligase
MSNAAEQLLGAEALARHGARDALLCGEERMTYAELAAAVRRAAGALAALGIRPGERVLIAMRDTPEFAATWLGAVHAGAVAVALNSRLGAAECRHVLADCSPRLLLAEDEFPLARAASSSLGAFRRAMASSPEAYAYPATPEHPAFMLYSSGTTGNPKGMVHTHHALLLLGASFRAFGIGEGARVLGTSKLFFAYGLDHGLLAPLATGATAILHPDWPDAAAVLALAERHRPTALFSVPTMYRRLLAEQRERLAALGGVSRFIAAGERISPQLLDDWRAATGGELLNLYGMSETFSACMVTPPGSSDGVRAGAALPGIDVRLDEAGVLWVRHPAQTAGYVNLPEQTAAQFRDGWFCTHDVFLRDEAGYFVHQGRSDELVKIAGQWVQPAEIEEIAVQASGVVDAACVLMAEGSGPERLALFIAVQGDGEAAVRAVEDLCARTLPRFKRPRWIRALSELPRTATGKVQRYKLREILAQELASRR